MKKLGVLTILAFIVCVSPSHAFLDYFFSGSDGRDAIDNSAVGDLRAWWTGNPAYQFNPYYSGSNNTQAKQQQAAPQGQQDPIVQYVPSQQNYAPQGYQQPGVPQQGYMPQQQQQYQPQQYGYQPQAPQQMPQQAYQPAQQQYSPQPYGAQQYPQQQTPMNYGQPQ